LRGENSSNCPNDCKQKKCEDINIYSIHCVDPHYPDYKDIIHSCNYIGYDYEKRCRKYLCIAHPFCRYSCRNDISFSYPCWTFYSGEIYEEGYCPDGQVCCYTTSIEKCYTTTTSSVTGGSSGGSNPGPTVNPRYATYFYDEEGNLHINED
jgi:hypothetical protein